MAQRLYLNEDPTKKHTRRPITLTEVCALFILGFIVFIIVVAMRNEATTAAAKTATPTAVTQPQMDTRPVPRKGQYLLDRRRNAVDDGAPVGPPK